MVILKVTIKIDQGAFTFWMHRPLGVKYTIVMPNEMILKIYS